MKRFHMRCPYCNSLAVRRPARDIFGADAKEPGGYLYVCARYPKCNAYVNAHKKSGLPMGTLADPDLRRKRILAHRALDSLWKHGPLTKKQAYRWLQGALGLPEAQAHIALFSHYQCDRVIALCSNPTDQVRKSA